MNVKQWLNDWRNAAVKKTMPVLSFPCVQLTGVTVRQLVSDSTLQAKGMKAVGRSGGFRSSSQHDGFVRGSRSLRLHHPLFRRRGAYRHRAAAGNSRRRPSPSDPGGGCGHVPEFTLTLSGKLAP